MLSNYKIGTRLFWQAVGMAFWFVVLVALAVVYMRDLNRDAKAIYQDDLEPLSIVLRIQTLMLANSQHVAEGLLLDPANPLAARQGQTVAEHTDAIVRNRDQITALWKEFKERRLNEQEAKLAETYEAARAVYVKDGLMAAREALVAGDFTKGGEVYGKVVRPAYAKVFEASEALRVYYADAGRRTHEQAQATFESTIKLMVGVALFVALLIAAFSYVFARSITRPLAGSVRLAEAIAGGKLDNAIVATGRDEVADLVHALGKMQDDLKARIEEERAAADANLRIKVALDGASNSVMVADPDGNIIYCNNAVLDMMRQAEADIRRDLPQFRADGILGSNFDIYHKNPAHQRNMLSKLQSSHRTELTIGGRYFALVATPIVNERRERLGTAVEWRDRTA